MRIALYGKHEEELQKWKVRIKGQFCNVNHNNFFIDIFTEERLLRTNLLRYDIVCLTEQFVDALGGREDKRVTFTWGKKIVSCYVDDIYYVEAELKNTSIRYYESEMLVHLPFSKVEQLLEQESFIKIHRSYLVNCRYIQGFDERSVHLGNGAVLPVSKYRMEEVHRQYLKYLEKRSRRG